VLTDCIRSSLSSAAFLACCKRYKTCLYRWHTLVWWWTSVSCLPLKMPWNDWCKKYKAEKNTRFSWHKPQAWHNYKKQSRRSQLSQECKDPCRQCFCDSWAWPLPSDSKINGFLVLIVEHFISCLVILVLLVFRHHAENQTQRGNNHTPATAVGIGNYSNMVLPVCHLYHNNVQ